MNKILKGTLEAATSVRANTRKTALELGSSALRTRRSSQKSEEHARARGNGLELQLKTFAALFFESAKSKSCDFGFSCNPKRTFSYYIGSGSSKSGPDPGLGPVPGTDTH